MRKVIPTLGLLFSLSPSVFPGSNRSHQLRPVALIHATVIDVKAKDSRLALKTDQTVVISGKRIAAIGKRVPIPPGAEVVDATGKFLIPGLWDMHVHTTHPSYFSLFVANGVSGIRDMGGAAADANNGCESVTPQTLMGWRERIRSGEWIGPRMLISGPPASATGWVTSLPVRTPEEARRAVETLRTLGVDFVKVYEKIPLDAYRTLASEARAAGLPLAGHVPVDTVSLPDAAKVGQRSVEHVRDHLLVCFTTDRDELLRFFKEDGWPEADVRWGLSKYGQCREAITAFRAHGTWLVPTLIVERAKAAVEEPRFVQDPRRAFLPVSIRRAFDAYVAKKLAQSGVERKSEHLWWLTQQRLVARMRAERIGFLAGTDSACEGGLPGFSLHEELQLLVEAGLTPLEALQTATINPAKYLSRTDSLGTLEPGKLADLVLLDGNPLEDIHNTQRIHSVVIGGRLLRRNDLDALLASVEASLK